MTFSGKLKWALRRIRKMWAVRENLSSITEIRRRLVTLRERHSGPRFHVPSDLEREETRPELVLIVGSCQAADWGYDRRNPSETRCDFVLTNNLSALPDSPPSELERYDFQIVQLPLRYVLADDAVWHLSYGDREGYERVFEDACQKLELQLSLAMKWNCEAGLLTFVGNFFLPQQNPMGRLFPRYDYRNIAYLVNRLNERLEGMVGGYSNAYLCDLDMLSSIYGRRFIQDDHLLWYSHGSIIESYGPNLSRLQPAPALDA